MQASKFTSENFYIYLSNDNIRHIIPILTINYTVKFSSLKPKVNNSFFQKQKKKKNEYINRIVQ